MTTIKLRIINLDRAHCIAHVALDTTHDRGIVVDDGDLEPHPVTGVPQPRTVFRGAIPECVAYVKAQA